MPDQEQANLLARLEALEARLAVLEAKQATAITTASPTPGANVDLLAYARNLQPEEGLVGFGGAIFSKVGQLIWEENRPLGHLQTLDWTSLAPSLAALAHPVRLQILRALFDGITSSQDLQNLPGLGTTGQLYHHLRDLQNTGWVRSSGRGQHTLVPDRVIALLVILMASSGGG
jgi:DNA-binding transcriptional ArsR family regulator